MMKPNMIAFSLAMLISVPAMAQFCATDTIRPTINPEQMIDNGDGTVTDAKTGLMWMQCSLGQTWTANGCSGSPMSYTWENALQAAALFNGKRLTGASQISRSWVLWLNGSAFAQRSTLPVFLTHHRQPTFHQQ
jgi:hypothetical protein